MECMWVEDFGSPVDATGENEIGLGIETNIMDSSHDHQQRHGGQPGEAVDEGQRREGESERQKRRNPEGGSSNVKVCTQVTSRSHLPSLTNEIFILLWMMTLTWSRITEETLLASNTCQPQHSKFYKQCISKRQELLSAFDR